MFDYKGWVERAQKFVIEAVPSVPHDDCSICADIAPPLTQQQLEQLQTEVGRPLPLELQRFWLTASRHCHCHYVLETEEKIYIGGAAFTDALKLSEDLFDCGEWADIVASWPDDPTLWLHSIPFCFLNNGDYLGLFMATPQDNPPVAYLSHDDESFILAESFTSFLETWEQLCYLGPESWELEEYRDANGYLNAGSHQSQALRDFFAGKFPQKLVPSPDEMADKCMSNLKRLGLAALMYSQDNNNIFPDAHHWCEELAVYDSRLFSRLRCPTIATGIGYAMNTNLSQANYQDIENPEKTILFFESKLTGHNAYGTVEALLKESRHPHGQITIGFADGHVDVMDFEQLSNLKWTLH